MRCSNWVLVTLSICSATGLQEWAWSKSKCIFHHPLPALCPSVISYLPIPGSLGKVLWLENFSYRSALDQRVSAVSVFHYLRLKAKKSALIAPTYLFLINYFVSLAAWILNKVLHVSRFAEGREEGEDLLCYKFSCYQWSSVSQSHPLTITPTHNHTHNHVHSAHSQSHPITITPSHTHSQSHPLTITPTHNHREMVTIGWICRDGSSMWDKSGFNGLEREARL